MCAIGGTLDTNVTYRRDKKLFAGVLGVNSRAQGPTSNCLGGDNCQQHMILSDHKSAHNGVRSIELAVQVWQCKDAEFGSKAATYVCTDSFERTLMVPGADAVPAMRQHDSHLPLPLVCEL